MTRGPMFVEAGRYRRRRLRDAARMLPVFGAFLVLLPILWAPALTERRDTAPDGIYLFAVWAVLILAAFAMARPLSRTEQDGAPPGADED
ncbi:MAG TPA: hypothetical protein PKD10_07550 [Paracoccaceae bacterium]|nr:hypothetical protein [Paracoccaceae bacterium]HMO73153.1 hypothetical protein [Paracoccaceae bacterium]